MIRLFLFFVTGVAVLIAFSKIFNFDKYPKFILVSAFVLAVLAAGLGAYEGCADGWNSTSIGRSGACSHHGGVETHANVYGICCMTLSGIVIFFTFRGSSNDK
ncbi:hypothetical protein J0X19_07610 [Hymenobacter sp. BT186]|uniref:Uncharacterized protein n=1 Tax=Hymenobacter telluris TaxID=2816474 RepID=A0A939JCG6_9BACT|nr:hypothetical protein [Hymenobacter telluris]MBW3373835.1 DUF3761 domain-containing protein [Hymenobacter norwichensis]